MHSKKMKEKATWFTFYFQNLPNGNNDPARGVGNYQKQGQLIEDSVQPNPPNQIEKEFHSTFLQLEKKKTERKAHTPNGRGPFMLRNERNNAVKCERKGKTKQRHATRVVRCRSWKETKCREREW